MAHFIAIPVAQGDAFYLETDAGSVLVDGGRSVSGFANLFRKYTGRDGVDVLVATHNDADHANGVLGFLQAGLKCNEVWLPGRWAELLPQVLRPWEEVVHVLLRQVEESRVSEIKPEGSLLEQYAETISQDLEAKMHDEEVLEIDESGWPVALIARLEEAALKEVEFWALSWWEYPWRRYWWRGYHPPSSRELRLFMEAIVAASRIREIALYAYHWGINVRWFEYNTRCPNGGFHWLEPLNSKQIKIIKPIKDKNFVNLLSLSVSNKESLVFWTPNDEVLFTADSDLKGVNIPKFSNAVVTAPHHGSESNKDVYNLINQPVTWVRSDGKYKKRPCSEYINIKGQKYCTLCRNQNSRKQAVFLERIQNNWKAFCNVIGCKCV